jgi:hypothetical protein
MAWTCTGPCGMIRDTWTLRCPTDGALQFPPAAATEPPVEAARFGPLAAARPGEAVLIGSFRSDSERLREHGRLRPARLAVLVALTWLAPIAIWAACSPPTFVPVVVVLAVLAAPAILGGLWLARRVPGQPGPRLRELAIAPFRSFAEWARAAFPGPGLQPVAIVNLETGPGSGVRIRVARPPLHDDRVEAADEPPPNAAPPTDGSTVGGTAVGPAVPAHDGSRDGWPPPPAPAVVRVVGRWIAEPELLDARVIQVLSAQHEVIRPPIYADRPRGWGWAVTILLVAGTLSGRWLLFLAS